MIEITSSGYQQSLYWGAESTAGNKYGSSVTVDQSFGLVQSVNPTETNNLIKIRTMGGTRDYNNIVPGKFEVSGSFEYFLQGGAFLRMAIGEDSGSTSTTDSGPRFHTGAASYVHVLGSAASPMADTFPSFTMEFTDEEDTGAVGTKNLKRTYNGCRINSLTISGTVDEPLSVSGDWIAQGVTPSTAAATSVTDSTDDPFVFYQGAVYATSAVPAYDTAITATTHTQIAEVNTFDFTVSNNLEPIWYISGTTAPSQTLRGLKNLNVKGRDYEASLGLHFKNKDMFHRFLGSNTATSPATDLNKYQVVLDFVRSGRIGSDPKLATDDYMRLVLGSCAFNDMNMPGSPEDIVSENIGVFVERAKLYVIDADALFW